jgi:hypothetical protein
LIDLSLKSGAAVSRATEPESQDARLAYVVLGVAAAHLLVVWLLRTPGLGWGEDDAQYLLLARSLQDGLRYREIWDVLEPLHQRYPPGFPSLLAVVGILTGNRLDALLLLVGLCSAASIVLLYDATRRMLSAEVASVVALLYACNPGAIQLAGNVMSEAPFTMLVVLALWALARESEGAHFAAIAGTATVLAALSRTAGIVFLPALGLYWLARRRHRQVLLLLLASVPVGLWLYWVFASPDPYAYRLYTADVLATTDPATSVIGSRLRDILPGIWEYLTLFFPGVLSLPTVRETVIDNVFWLFVLVLCGGIGLLTLARRWLAAFLFTGAYLGLLVVWVFSFERLVHPIVPFLYLVIIIGTSVALSSFALKVRRAAVGVLALVMVFGAMVGNVEAWRQLADCDRSRPAESRSCWPEAERHYLQLASWVRDSTPADAVFFVPKEAAFYYHSGRRSINQIRGLREDAASIAPYLRSIGVDYAVVTYVGPRGRDQIRLIASACHEFAQVREYLPWAALFRVRELAEAPDPTACATLQSMLKDLGNGPPS